MFILLKAVGILPSCLQVSDPMAAPVDLCGLWGVSQGSGKAL